MQTVPTFSADPTGSLVGGWRDRMVRGETRRGADVALHDATATMADRSDELDAMFGRGATGREIADFRARCAAEDAASDGRH